MKCDKLLKEANKQYKDIIASLDALKRGEISGSKANADIMRAFDRVDESIKEYEKQQPELSGFFSCLDNSKQQAYYILNYIYKRAFICFVWFAWLCGRSTRSQVQIFACDSL